MRIMWQDILKKPITIGTTRIGLKPMSEEDDCNRKLKKYADKLKNMKFVYGDMLYRDGEPPYKKYEETTYANKVRGLYDRRLYWDWKDKNDVQGFPIEIVEFFYEPMPEEVACKALEVMNHDNNKKSKIMDYTISWYSSNNIMYLDIIDKDWQNVVSLAHIVEDLKNVDWNRDDVKEDYTRFFDAYKNANIDWR